MVKTSAGLNIYQALHSLRALNAGARCRIPVSSCGAQFLAWWEGDLILTAEATIIKDSGLGVG